MNVRAIGVVLAACLLLGVLPTFGAERIGEKELSGKVVDDNGQPIAGVLVDVWHWYKGDETTTADDGTFHLKDIGGADDGERVEVRFTKEGLSPHYIRSQSLGDNALNITMNDRTYFEGKVLGIDGKPVANALVRGDSGPKTADGLTITTIWTETTSDAEGIYRLRVAPDTYKLQVRIADKGIAYLKATVGENEAVTQDIQLGEGIRFVIKCIDGDTNEPAAGVKVRVPRQKGMEATSGPDGLAVFKFMPAETFEFNINANNEFPRWWWPDSADKRQRSRDTNWNWSSSGMELAVSAESPQVTVMVERGAQVSGKVLDPDGNPVANALVVTALTGYGDAVDQTQRFTTRSKKDGAFSFRLPSTSGLQMNLIAHDGDYRTFRTFANGVCEPFVITSGEDLADAVLQLTKPGTITGVVVDKQGKPKANKEVRAMSVDGCDSRYVAPHAKTDAEGKFEITHVRPGEVRVEVEPFWMHFVGGDTPTPIDHGLATVEAGGTTSDVSVTSTRD